MNLVPNSTQDLILLFHLLNFQKLPQVNKELAAKLMEEAESISEKESLGKKVKAGQVVSSSLLKDTRFKAMFENPAFQIDKNADEFRQFSFIMIQLYCSNFKLLHIGTCLTFVHYLMNFAYY